MRYFLHLAYNGSKYSGWQRQANSLGIQEVIEQALHKIFKKQVNCAGCGRTDAKVHASQYFAQIDIDKELDFDLAFILNKILPHDIVIFDVISVSSSQNVRQQAHCRTYDYFIHLNNDPFLYDLSSFYDIKDIDVSLMKQAVDLLPKHNNYQSLCLCPNKHNTTLCNVFDAKLFTSKNKKRIRFQISANRFMRGMIRIIISKLIDIGTGKLSIEQFREILTNPQPPSTFNLAWPQGLYLTKVSYPFLDVECNSEFMSIIQNDEWIEILA